MRCKTKDPETLVRIATIVCKLSVTNLEPKKVTKQCNEEIKRLTNINTNISCTAIQNIRRLYKNERIS